MIPCAFNVLAASAWVTYAVVYAWDEVAALVAVLVAMVHILIAAYSVAVEVR